MAYTTINKSGDYFNTKLYTGNGGTQSITGVGFQPDWVWIKQRSNAEDHFLFDSVRGAKKRLISNSTDVEDTHESLTSFNSDGFSLGNARNEVNQNGASIVAWNWKANGQGSPNTAGSINTTYTSVNTTAGFSIVKWTGNGSNGATIGHGLGAVPKMMIFKILSSADDWTVYHSFLGAGKKLNLNNNDAEATVAEIFNNTEPTSSLITFGTHSRTNTNGANYVGYIFAEKTGYSKFGSYTGNGNADGTFVYTGFKPAFVMIKETNTNGTDWRMMDNKRSTFNLVDDRLFPNLNNVENTGDGYDFLSNGFKIRSSGGDFNGSGDSYIYMCFAEAPLVGTNNVPCTAR